MNSEFDKKLANLSSHHYHVAMYINSSSIHVQRVEAALVGALGQEVLSSRMGRPGGVFIVESKDLATVAGQVFLKGKVPGSIDAESLSHMGPPSVAQAFFAPTTRSIVMVADNIPEGAEVGVYLHEVMHRNGGERIGQDRMERLAGTVKRWEFRHADSLEQLIFQAASRRAKRGVGDGGVRHDEELFAYAVEEAVRRGVKPNISSPLDSPEQWLADVIATLQSVIYQEVQAAVDFDAQQLVNLAYALAQMEIPERAQRVMQALQTANGKEQSSARSLVARKRPEFFSQLQRSIESVPDRMAAMAAPQWRLWLDANASKLGVKKDEIEWSSIKDYLTLRGKDKVTRDELVAYLGNNGVQVTETQLGYSPNETGRAMLAVKYDEAIAAAEAAGTALNPTYIETLDPARRKPEEQALLDAFKAVDANPEESYLRQNDPARYNQYVVPGGSNYREVLLTLPAKTTADPARAKYEAWAQSNGLTPNATMTEQRYERETGQAAPAPRTMSAMQSDAAQNYKSAHWDALNILAHLRVDDRVDADGNKVLMIQEIQSDWGQDGKKKGFAAPRWTKEEEARVRELEAPRPYPGLSESEREEFSVLMAKQDAPGLPAAPFVTDTKAWASLALKRAIMMAVEEGHDKIAIITGEQAAGLYSLEKQIDSIAVGEMRDTSRRWVRIEPKSGSGFKLVVDQNAKVVDTGPGSREFEGKQLDDVIGKDMAKKIMAAVGEQEFSGLDLKVGGEGLITFYNQIIPQVARDVLKKLGGGQLQVVNIGESNGGKFAIMRPDGQMHSYSGSGGTITFDSRARAQAQVNKLNRVEPGYKVADAQKQGGEQLGFAITPAMRELAVDGLPSFSLADISHHAVSASARSADTSFGCEDEKTSYALEEMLASEKALEQLRSGDVREITIEKWMALSDRSLNAKKALTVELSSIPDDEFALQAKASGGRSLVLTSSAQQPGKWQLTRFDAQGDPWGDTNYTTKERAIRELIDEADLSTLADGAGASFSCALSKNEEGTTQESVDYCRERG